LTLKNPFSMDRFSPSSSSDDEAMTDVYDHTDSGSQQQWGAHAAARIIPGLSNIHKRRAGGAPANGPPFVKNKRGEERGRFVGGRQDTKKEDLVDVELVLFLRKAIGDPFDEMVVRRSS